MRSIKILFFAAVLCISAGAIHAQQPCNKIGLYICPGQAEPPRRAVAAATATATATASAERQPNNAESFSLAPSSTARATSLSSTPRSSSRQAYTGQQLSYDEGDAAVESQTDWDDDVNRDRSDVYDERRKQRRVVNMHRVNVGMYGRHPTIVYQGTFGTDTIYDSVTVTSTPGRGYRPDIYLEPRYDNWGYQIPRLRRRY